MNNDNNNPKASKARNAKASQAVVISDNMDAAQAKELFIASIEAQSAGAVIQKRTRAQLATLAGVIFKGVTVTTAAAAVALGLELSVKHLDKGLTEERAFVQGQRVTLQRALKDAGVLKVDAAKGRKTAGQKAEENGEDADGKSPSKGQLGVVLAALSHLTEDELEQVAEAISELHIQAL